MAMFRKKKKEEEEMKRVDFEDEEEEEEEIEEQPVRRGRKKQVPEYPMTWIVKEIPTQTQPIIVNQTTKKKYDLYSAIVEILNKLEEE